MMGTEYQPTLMLNGSPGVNAGYGRYWLHVDEFSSRIQVTDSTGDHCQLGRSQLGLDSFG